MVNNYIIDELCMILLHGWEKGAIVEENGRIAGRKVRKRERERESFFKKTPQFF